MIKLQNKIDRITTMISAFLFAIVMVILTYNVFARFLGGGIQWYMESSQYLNVWAMFIAGIGISIKNEHLRINALEEALRGPAKKVLQILVAVSTAAFYLLLAYGFFLLASKSKQNISTMGTLKMAYVYWPVPVICLLSAFSSALNILIPKNDENGGTTQ